MRQRQQSDTTYVFIFFMAATTDVSKSTPVVGLIPTVRLSKNGGALTAPIGPVTEIGAGLYKLTPNKADVDTLGELILHATGTGAFNVDDVYDIVGSEDIGKENLADPKAGKITVTRPRV